MFEITALFEKIENEIGYSLPDEFKCVYSDNQKIKKLNLMNLDEIYNEVCNAKNDQEDSASYRIIPQNSILAKSFDKKRVPFIKDYSGNFIGIDFNPGKKE